MKNFIKSILTFLAIVFFVVTAIATGDSNLSGNKIDADLTKEEIKEAIKGKWSSSIVSGGAIYGIKYEITDDKVKIWRKANEMAGAPEDYDDYSNEPDEIVNYSIGDMRVVNQYWKQIDIAEGNFGKLVIIYYNDNDFGYFQYVNGSQEETMWHDWEH